MKIIISSLINEILSRVAVIITQENVVIKYTDYEHMQKHVQIYKLTSKRNA